MTSEKTDGDLRLARALVLRDHPTNEEPMCSGFLQQ